VPKAFFRGMTTGARDLKYKNSVGLWEQQIYDWMQKDFDKNRWKNPRANLALKSEEFP